MRTQEEIINKISEVKSDDWMGTITSDLVNCLEFSNAKDFLKDEITEKEWQENGFMKNTDGNIKKEMQEYLSFAFGKAEDERGISAGRSMDHYYAWIWLLDEETHFGDVREYDSYGIPHLNKIKSFLGQ